MQTTELKSVLLSKADIAQIAKEFKKEIDESYSDAFSYPYEKWEFWTEINGLVISVFYNMWAENRRYHAATYTEPEDGEDAYGVSIVYITACDGELGDVEIENEGDLDEAINGYTNVYEWS